MFRNKFLLFIIFSFVWVPFLFGQTESINLINRGLANYQDIFVSDLDILNTGTARDLFGIELSKSSGAMDGEITISLTKDSDLLATILTNRFQFPVESGTWSFTNLQLSQGNYDFEGQGTRIRVSDSETYEENSSKIINEMESTLKVPFGTYELTATITFFPSIGSPIILDATEQIIINITNPYTLSQITPGNTLNSGFVYQLFTLNPIFQWNGNSGLYQIAVFKKQSDFSSPEDILNSQPVWESDKINTLFTSYPEDNAVPLEYGAEYVWQVRSFVSTSSGENIIQSELWEFNIVDPSTSGTTEESMAKQEFETLLRQFLGDDAESIIRELSNYNLTIIRVNGEILSLPAFYKILEKYRDQENEISDIFLRSSN